jgi:hypothetical protein
VGKRFTCPPDSGDDRERIDPLSSLVVSGSFVETVGNPGVQAFACLAGGNRGPALEIGREAKDELAGEWFFRVVSKLLAEGKIVCHRIVISENS